MAGLRERAAEGLQVGDSFQTFRTFTNDDVLRFARISRDYNPVHFDARFAAARNFSAPICHGLLVASLITEIGGQIGWLASAFNLRFKGPVYVGERLRCTWVITEIDPQGRATASVTITKQDGVKALEAEIGGIVPGGEAQTVMGQLIDEGDHTNGPHNTQQCR
ncbi:MaoC family dehydratase [Desulfovermiculus halophilus]|jgi:acyl dehydratase|uniref:MaoC family dehydratase n=1 Tax=Desulfovermiculus halophilus TaxID=339722 RepID=UPI000482EED6|nr:MaoC family dehydratase [Desulfovermiculus halophilus]